MAFHSIRALSYRALPFALYFLLSAALASSQTTSSSPSSDASSAVTTAGGTAASSASPSSSTKDPVTHTIDVAKGGFTFIPDVVQADVGDIIRFLFYPQNHSVVRAAYEYPCIPYETTYGADDVQGFFSGFQPVDAILDNPPSFDVRVNDTYPIFYYCSAPGSCINYAMVGVINPNSSVSLATQKQLAKDSTYMLEPGQQPPSEEDPFKTASISLPAATASSTSRTASATSAAAASTSTAAAATSGHSGLSTGAIAGIAVGAALGGILIAALFFLYVRNKALHKTLDNTNARALGPEQSERGSYFYGSAPSHISGAYMPDKATTLDRQSYVSSAYQSTAGPPGYAHHPMPSPVRSETMPVVEEGMRSPSLGVTSPLVRPQSSGERTFTGMSTLQVDQHEVFEKPDSGPHELAASASRAKKRLSGRKS